MKKPATRCRDCGHLFGPKRPKRPRSRRCEACYLVAKRTTQRASYERRHAERLGLPRGPKPGSHIEGMADGGVLAARLADFYAAARAARLAGPRSLARTCGFCGHLALDAGLLQQESCELDRKPNASGGCDGWEPRYRVDGDE